MKCPQPIFDRWNRFRQSLTCRLLDRLITRTSSAWWHIGLTIVKHTSNMFVCSRLELLFFHLLPSWPHIRLPVAHRSQYNIWRSLGKVNTKLILELPVCFSRLFVLRSRFEEHFSAAPKRRAGRSSDGPRSLVRSRSTLIKKEQGKRRETCEGEKREHLRARKSRGEMQDTQ